MVAESKFAALNNFQFFSYHKGFSALHRNLAAQKIQYNDPGNPIYCHSERKGREDAQRRSDQ